METRKTVQGQQLFRGAEFSLESINEEARTVDVVWTTGYKGKRRSFWGDDFFEELEVSDSAVRLERLNNGAPLLASHNGYSLRGVIGVVERAWIKDGKGYATIRFSEREEAEEYFRDVKAKILRNISVGYTVHRYLEEVQEGDQLKTLRATDWEPMELSLVPIGFDPEAQTRSGETLPVHDIEIISTTQDRSPGEMKNETTPVEETRAAKAPEAPAKPEVNVDDVKREAAEAERKRMVEIRKAVRAAKLDDKFADKLCEDGVSVDEARAKIIDAWAENDNKEPVRSQVRIEAGSRDEIVTRREAVAGALLHRIDPSKNELNDASLDYRGRSLIEISRSLLEARGTDTRGWSKSEIATRALHSTSDFANILADVANNRLRMAYESSPQTFRPIVRETEAPDFRTIQSSQLGEGSALEQVVENAEFKRGTISDSKETYQLLTYGKVFGMSRQLLINDSLDAFARLPMMLGRRAADKESDLVWAVFTANAAMADGTALFHADHGNLGSAAAINETSMSAGRAAMRTQTGPDGANLNIIPMYLISPAAKEGKARQYLSTEMVASSAANINTHRGTMEPIIEPRLDAASTTAWYMAADPSQVDTIEIAYLEGQRGVYMETREGFNVDGVEWKVRLDVGVKAVDWRGLYKNPGS